MAINQQIVDRYKAEGFYRWVEWNRRYGVLIRTFDEPVNGRQKVTFQVGTFDVEYDQRVDGYRQFFVSRKKAVEFMMNMKLSAYEIAAVFRAIDGCQEVTKYV